MRALPVGARRVRPGNAPSPGAIAERARRARKRCDPQTERPASQSRREARAASNAAGLPEGDAGPRHGTGGRIPADTRGTRGGRRAELPGPPGAATGKSQEVSPRGVSEEIQVTRRWHVRGSAHAVAGPSGGGSSIPGWAGGSARGDRSVHRLRRLRDALPDGRADGPLDGRGLRSELPAVGVHQLPGLRDRLRAPGDPFQGDRSAGRSPWHGGGPALPRPKGDLPPLS